MRAEGMRPTCATARNKPQQPVGGSVSPFATVNKHSLKSLLLRSPRKRINNHFCHTRNPKGMSVHSFAGLNARPSPWGYNWTSNVVEEPIRQVQQQPREMQEEEDLERRQLAHMPAALLSTLKREKKPFTYTPGGVNLPDVLNARLQRRMERKKRYSEVQQQSQKQLIVMPTYNTPLDMYSMENALEALEVQAELAAADKRSTSAILPRNPEKDLDPGRGVAQSKAFRVLQIITDTEEDPADKSRVQHRDEMRFTGLRESKAIPSKFFQTLQKITGTDEEEDEEPPHHLLAPPTTSAQHPVNGNQPLRRPISFPPSEQDAPTTLRRPAAFLPPTVAPCFRPMQFLQKATAGTDF